MTVSTGSLVKETSTTTGTGSYALAGAATNFRAFSAIVTPGATALVPYVARMGAAYESGIGLLSAATTLQRVGIYESSNGNAAVDWAAGTKEIYASVGGTGVAALGKCNFAGAAAPGVNDNYLDGYGHGSLLTWVESAGGYDHNNVWLCVDPGIPGSVNAKWVLLGTASINRLANSSSGLARRSIDLGGFNSEFADDTAAPAGVVAVGYGGRALWSNSLLQGNGWPFNDGGHQTIVSIGGSLQTTNATTTPLDFVGNAEGAVTYLLIEESSCLIFDGSVVAREEATGDCKAVTVRFAVKRASTGDPAIVGSASVTTLAEDAGAAAWTVAVAIDTANDGVQINCTGEASHTIRWTGSFRVTQVAFT